MNSPALFVVLYLISIVLSLWIGLGIAGLGIMLWADNKNMYIIESEKIVNAFFDQNILTFFAVMTIVPVLLYGLVVCIYYLLDRKHKAEGFAPHSSISERYFEKKKRSKK